MSTLHNICRFCNTKLNEEVAPGNAILDEDISEAALYRKTLENFLEKHAPRTIFESSCLWDYHFDEIRKVLKK